MSTYTQNNFAYYIKPPLKTVFEIGCRDGEDTKAILNAYKPDRIVCLECNPEAIDNLRRDTARFPNVTVVPKAATEFDGATDFWRVVRSVQSNGKVGRNIGASSLYQESGLYAVERFEQERIQVQATRVETLCRELQIEEIHLVCMDVQGAALSVLRGFGPIIEKTKFIITELEFIQIYKDQALVSDVMKYLFSYGFSLMGAAQQNTAFGDFLFAKIG